MTKESIINDFKGFSSPNYTQVPDEVFDQLLSVLSGAELKALMYVIRRTFGFKKNNDDISFNQMMNGVKKKDGTILDRGTGLSKPTLVKALNGLVDKKILIKKKQKNEFQGNLPSNYSLNVIIYDPSKEILQGGYNNFTKGEENNLTNPPSKKNKPTIINSDLNNKEYNNNIISVVVSLQKKGIIKTKAELLAKNNDVEKINEKINFLDYQIEHGTEIKNPAGYLIKAIEEDYPVPEKILVKQEKIKKYQKKKDEVINKLKNGFSITLDDYIYLPGEITSKLRCLYAEGNPDEYILREGEYI